MKKILIVIALFTSTFSIAQNDPIEITPAILKKITDEVEKEVFQFQKALKIKEMTSAEMEFATDTFRLDRIMEKRLDIDYTTFGMNEAVNQHADGYDKLMNKYYNKLLKVLSAADKKIVIKAQKAWLAYRDSQAELIWMMTKEEYSGGGTIQSNIATSDYNSLVIDRTLVIFSYYNTIFQNQQ